MKENSKLCFIRSTMKMLVNILYNIMHITCIVNVRINLPCSISNDYNLRKLKLIKTKNRGDYLFRKNTD